MLVVLWPLKEKASVFAGWRSWQLCESWCFLACRSRENLPPMASKRLKLAQF
jgi:hypothetical protein